MFRAMRIFPENLANFEQHDFCHILIWVVLSEWEPDVVLIGFSPRGVLINLISANVVSIRFSTRGLLVTYEILLNSSCLWFGRTKYRAYSWCIFMRNLWSDKCAFWNAFDIYIYGVNRKFLWNIIIYIFTNFDKLEKQIISII